MLLLFVHPRFVNLRDFLGQALDQVVDIRFQLLPFTGRQANMLRTCAIDQIVNIAPVVGNGLACGLTGEISLDGGSAASAGLAEDEEVETTVADADTEVDGGQCPFLANGSFQGRQLLGTDKFELAGLAAPTQLIWSEAQIVHDSLLVDPETFHDGAYYIVIF